MMPKYLVLKTDDLKTHLSPEEQQQLYQLMSAIKARSVAKDPKARTPVYFVLNMLDKFSIATVETYVRECDNDEAHTNPGVQAARKVAEDARQWGIMNSSGTKLPS